MIAPATVESKRIATEPVLILNFMGEAALKLLDWGVEALVPELVVVELVTEEVAGLVFVVPKPEVAAGGV